MKQNHTYPLPILSGGQSAQKYIDLAQYQHVPRTYQHQTTAQKHRSRLTMRGPGVEKSVKTTCMCQFLTVASGCCCVDDDTSCAVMPLKLRSTSTLGGSYVFFYVFV